MSIPPLFDHPIPYNEMIATNSDIKIFAHSDKMNANGYTSIDFGGFFDLL